VSTQVHLLLILPRNLTEPSHTLHALKGSLSHKWPPWVHYDKGIAMLRLIGSSTVLVLLMVGCGGDGKSDAQGPPMIGAASPPGGVTGVVYPGYTFTVGGGGQWPFTWSATGAVPPGLALSATGQLTGTPLSAGSYAFTVKVTDSSRPALTATASANLKIDAMTISSGPPPQGVHGVPYSYTFSAAGGNLPLRWSAAGALPPGLTLDRDGTLSGTPTVATTTKPPAFVVTVTDSSAPIPETSSVQCAIGITEPAPPLISNTPPPTATVGEVYSFPFTASDGLAPFVWTPPTAPMGGLAVGLDGVLSGTPSTAGMFPITLTVKDALNRTSPAAQFTVRVALARPAAAFMPTRGTMTVARNSHTATLLENGQVLIAGGTDGASALASAELYDPASQSFTATGSMAAARSAHSAILLENSKLPNYGKVLIVGGGGSSAELFDTTSGTFTATGSMLAQRVGQTATLLQSGQVLIAGGGTASAELFNPSTGKFTATGNMTVSRSGHTEKLLPDGRVLIAGGATATDPATASAELYDPASGRFAPTSSMSEGRSGQTATLLVDGTVLVTGPDNTAELFATGTFSAAGELSARSGATATLRSDGTVLVAGGISPVTPSSTGTAELFAPESGGFVTTASLITGRAGHTATSLADGTVLITGGIHHIHYCARFLGCFSSDTVLSSAELFK